MSLDDRLRAGLRDAAAVVDPDVEVGLARARREGARRRDRRRLVVAAAAVAVAVAGGVPLGQRLTGDDSVSAGPTTDAASQRRLVGTWVTPVVTRAQAAAVLDDAGLAEYADAVLLAQAYPTAWNLRFDRDRYVAASASGVQQDVGTWEVDGDVLVLRPEQCPCTLRFAWNLVKGRLSLRLLSDDSPAVDGVPDEAPARALYTTVPFTRFRASP